MSKYTYNKLKSICFEILKKVDNKLGSTNIKNTFYSRHLDKYIVNEGIIFKQKNHTVDALVYEDINQLKKDKLSLIRNMYREYMNTKDSSYATKLDFYQKNTA